MIYIHISIYDMTYDKEREKVEKNYHKKKD